jgi:THO complex subunit 2
MENTRRRWMDSMTVGGGNALTESAALIDDAPAASDSKPTGQSSQAQETTPTAKLQPPQRIQLLQALLSVGDMPTSLYLLNRYPWVAQAHPLIADLILQFVAHAVETRFRLSVPAKWGSEGEEAFDLEQPNSTIDTQTPREIVTTLSRPVPPMIGTKSFQYFYPYCSDTLESWETADELLSRGRRWLSLVRGLGGRSPDVIVKICRIGTAHFSALRKKKESQLGFSHGARTKDDLRQVEVSHLQYTVDFSR